MLAELAAGLVAVVALVLAAEHAAHFAGTLTVVGTAIALLAVLRHDRVHLGWAGSAVLTVGTLVRLDLPRTIGAEVYTLPAAALLIAAGVHRLLREPRTALDRARLRPHPCPGAEPPDLAARPDLASSVPRRRRRSDRAGGRDGASLAGAVPDRRRRPRRVRRLSFLLPLAQDILANPLGAWMLFGSLGAACLAVGALWEQSLRNVRLASRYVGALR